MPPNIIGPFYLIAAVIVCTKYLMEFDTRDRPCMALLDQRAFGGIPKPELKIIEK